MKDVKGSVTHQQSHNIFRLRTHVERRPERKISNASRMAGVHPFGHALAIQASQVRTLSACNYRECLQEEACQLDSSIKKGASIFLMLLATQAGGLIYHHHHGNAFARAIVPTVEKSNLISKKLKTFSDVQVKQTSKQKGLVHKWKISREEIGYNFQKVLQLNVSQKIFGLCALSMPIVVILGAIHHWSSGESLKSSMFKSYAILANVPGADTTGEENLLSLLSLNVAFFIGLFTFAVFLGIIVSDIEENIQEMKYSNSYKIYETNHTLILNWNRYTVPILRSMAKSLQGSANASTSAFGMRKKTVVIVADKSKEEMDNAIDYAEGLENLDIISRSSSPSSSLALERASAGEASEIIILDDDDQTLDQESQDIEFSCEASSLLHLSNSDVIGMVDSKAHSIVVQANTNALHEKHPMKLAASVHQDHRRSEIAISNGNEQLGRIMAMSALQPNIWQVLSRLFTYMNDSASTTRLFIKDIPPKLEGRTFQDLYHMFPNANLLGFTNSKGAFQLCPGINAVARPGEKLVFAAPNNRKIATAEPNAIKDRAVLTAPFKLSTSPHEKAKQSFPKEIMVIGLDNDNPISIGVLASILDCVQESATITLLQPETLKTDSSNQLFSDRRLKFHIVESLNHESLVSAGIKNCDSVIVLQDSSKTKAEQDAESMLIALYMSDIFKDASKIPHVVFSLHKLRTASTMEKVVINKIMRAGLLDCISEDSVVAGLLVRLSSSPSFQNVYNELLSSVGSELYIVDAKEYADSSVWVEGDRLDYTTLCSHAVQNNNIPLGYIEPGSPPVLCPDRQAHLPISSDSKLVVLAL